MWEGAKELAAEMIRRACLPVDDPRSLPEFKEVSIAVNEWAGRSLHVLLIWRRRGSLAGSSAVRHRCDDPQAPASGLHVGRGQDHQAAAARSLVHARLQVKADSVQGRMMLTSSAITVLHPGLIAGFGFRACDG